MTTENDLFEMSAPAPLASITENVVHPENAEVIEGDNSARRLTKKQIKQIKAARDEALAVLEEYQYDLKKAEYDEIERQLSELKSLFYLAKQDGNKTEANMHLLKARELKERGKLLKEQIAPAMKAAARMQRINARIDEHRIAVENEALYKKLRDDMAKEASIYGEIIIRTWARLGYRHARHVNGKWKVSYVKFQRVIATEDEIQFKIDVSSLTLLGSTQNDLPYGVHGWDLVKPETLRELTIACEREVTSPHIDEEASFRNGAWIVVHRLGLSDGLFNYVSLHQVLAKYSDSMRSKFPIPMGVKRGRRVNWVSLADHPHLMFNGQSGSGKTNAIRVALSTLVQKHSPDELRLILTDLKRGGDLNYYARTPHILGNIVKEPVGLRNMLARLTTLMHQRMETFSRADVIDINDYNKRAGPDRAMCRILVVIDEYTAIYMDADAAKSINLLATIIATQARAAGIHLLIGNQQPYSDRVPKDVKGNVSFILTGRQRTAGASMSTTGDTSARKLPKIPGRMLCDDGEDFYQVQIPHAREQDIYVSLDAANNYPEPRELDLPEPDESIEATGQIFGIDDIIDLALKHFDGALKSRKIWALDECPASQNEVTRWIKEIASRDEIHHGEDVYKPVKKPGNYFVLEHVEPADSQIRSIEDGSIGESERETALETDLEAKYETEELEMIS